MCLAENKWVVLSVPDAPRNRQVTRELRAWLTERKRPQITPVAVTKFPQTHGSERQGFVLTLPEAGGARSWDGTQGTGSCRAVKAGSFGVGRPDVLS